MKIIVEKKKKNMRKNVDFKFPRLRKEDIKRKVEFFLCLFGWIEK